MPPNNPYSETIDYLYALQHHGIKLALENSIALMEIMGSPHRKFRSIHVAGTNGKGSTSAFTAAILRAAGYRVGLYTSPHLVSFTERISVDGVRITEAKVVELVQRIRDGYQKRTTGIDLLHPTFFEVTTAIAFTHFAEEDVDIAVVEVGMGGRLDSTNIITPLVSVITNIDLEHTEFLGNTLEQIATEKAGIIKLNVPVVTGAVQPEVVRVIENEASLRSARVHRLLKDFKPENISSYPERQIFDYQGLKTKHDCLAIGMLGRYQVDNACIALAAIECLQEAGIKIDERAVRGGLAETVWQGRLERVGRNPDIYLDGAHNPASARMLAEAVRTIKSGYEKLILVIGILGDKDYRGIISEVVPLADRVIATRADYGRAMEPGALGLEARRFNNFVETAETVGLAIARARQKAAANDLIIITGSLYVVGDARRILVEDSIGAFSRLKG